MSAVLISGQLGQYFKSSARKRCVACRTTKRLTILKAAAYSGRVPEKEGTGFGDLNLTMADNRLRRSFFVQSTVPPMGGSGGDTFGYAGFRCHRFANPAICRPPRLATGRAVLQPTTEDTMSSFSTPVLSPSALTRIDGIDVSQLLRDIGEATACTDPIELFRLCIGAQRVLSHAHDISAGGTV